MHPKWETVCAKGNLVILRSNTFHKQKQGLKTCAQRACRCKDIRTYRMITRGAFSTTNRLFDQLIRRFCSRLCLFIDTFPLSDRLWRLLGRRARCHAHARLHSGCQLCGHARGWSSCNPLLKLDSNGPVTAQCQKLSSGRMRTASRFRSHNETNTVQKMFNRYKNREKTLREWREW
jgi:hypothetical protein